VELHAPVGWNPCPSGGGCAGRVTETELRPAPQGRICDPVSSSQGVPLEIAIEIGIEIGIGIGIRRGNDPDGDFDFDPDFDLDSGRRVSVSMTQTASRRKAKAYAPANRSCAPPRNKFDIPA